MAGATFFPSQCTCCKLATWPPAGGVIRVVLVKNDDGWVAYFCTNRDATVADILGLVADRAAIESAGSITLCYLPGYRCCDRRVRRACDV